MDTPNQTSATTDIVSQITSRDYALAAFIIGCLVQAEVIQIGTLGSDEMSDYICGIRIVAACLKDHDSESGRYKLPFQW